MSNLKVLMFGWEFPPKSSGGLGTACYGLAKALSTLGVSLTIVLPFSFEKYPNFLAKFVSTNVKVKLIPSLLEPYHTSQSYQQVYKSSRTQAMYGSSLFEEVARFTKEAERIALEEDYDIIHCHDWMTFGAGIRAANISGKPLIVHIHATEFDRTGGHGVNKYVYDLEQAGMHRANRVITVSGFTKSKVIQHYGVPENKVTVVHNGVDASDIAGHEHFPIKQNSKIVLYLGRMTLQKGPEYFLYAAKRVHEIEPDTLFVMAGTGDMQAHMVELSAELGIGDKVLFTGYLKPEQTNRIYNMADVFVMPSVSEPFGITPLEAIKNGTPCVISKQSGVSEVISHALKADFWDTDDFSNKIIALLKYRELHQTLAENALHQVKYINWESAASKCIIIYNELLIEA